MPRWESISSTQQSSLLRHYLSHATPADGDAILRDAFSHGEPGARELVRLGASVRCNRRTRRSMEAFEAEHFRGRRAKWYQHHASRVMALFKVLRKMALPNAPAHGRAPRVSARQERELVQFGLFRRNRETLKNLSTRMSTELLTRTADSQMVLWLDNLYWQRYSTDPGEVDLSQNVSAMATLILDDVTQLRVATRRVRFPDFPGHWDLQDILANLDAVVTHLRLAHAEMQAGITRMNAITIQRKHVRVPLDIQRPQRMRMIWRPWGLAQQQVGNTVDLLSLLLDVVDVQRHSQHVLPLLVDENIHYRILRLMHSASLSRWDVSHLLRDVPLVYGIWHAYKHTVVCVYRAFFPLLAQLENTGQPVVGGRVQCRRKVLYLEKVFALLVLLRDTVQGDLLQRQRDLQAKVTRTCVSPCHGHPGMVTQSRLRSDANWTCFRHCMTCCTSGHLHYCGWGTWCGSVPGVGSQGAA